MSEHYAFSSNGRPMYPSALVYNFEEALGLVCSDDPDGPRGYLMDVRWDGESAVLWQYRVRRSGERYRWSVVVSPCTGSVCRHRDREVVEYAHSRMLRMAAR